MRTYLKAIQKAIGIFRSEGLASVVHRLLQRFRYARWVKRYGRLTDTDRAAIRGHLETFTYRPLISVLMASYNTPEAWLRAAIDSIRKQIYPHWQLCIADDASSLPHVKALLESYRALDLRIKVVFREGNGHISAASNSALALVEGEFILLMDHDDVLAEHALYLVAEALNRHPEADLIYSDLDKIDHRSRRFDPYFKTDWNPDLFLSHNLIAHLDVYRAEIVRRIGGFRLGYEGSQDYDLALRVIEQTPAERIIHLPYVLYHWRAIPESLASNPEAKSYAHEAARKAIRSYLEHERIPAQAAAGMNRVLHRVVYCLPEPLPLVSLILLARGQGDAVPRAVESVLGKTDYEHVELLIVGNPATTSLETFAGDSRVHLLDCQGSLNTSRMLNLGGRRSNGEVIGFLHEDIVVKEPGWLQEMVSHALRPEIGAVGAKICRPNGTVQHAGFVLGLGGVVGNIHRGLHSQQGGYAGRARLIQNLSAVSAACMVMRRTIFDLVGGFDEWHLPMAFHDVDLCLRIQEHGYRVLWTPYAELIQHESTLWKSGNMPDKRAHLCEELDYMKSRWGRQLENDPYYSPNLSLHREDGSPAFPPRTRKPWLDR